MAQPIEQLMHNHSMQTQPSDVMWWLTADCCSDVQIERLQLHNYDYSQSKQPTQPTVHQ